MRTVKCKSTPTNNKRCAMTELFTMIVLAANIVVASAFARFAPTAAADVGTAHEQSSDADTFEGRVVAKIRGAKWTQRASRDIGESPRYWVTSLLKPVIRSSAMEATMRRELIYRNSGNTPRRQSGLRAGWRDWKPDPRNGTDLAIWHERRDQRLGRARRHSPGRNRVGDAWIEPGTTQHMDQD